MKRFILWEWGTLSLVTLFAAALLAETLAFHSLPIFRCIVLWHQRRSSVAYMKSSVLINSGCFRYPLPMHVLFDGTVTDVRYDNESGLSVSSPQLPYSPDNFVQARTLLTLPRLDIRLDQLSKPFRPQQETTASWHRAVDQINSLFDLASEKNMDSPTVSLDLVLTALESFVHRIRTSLHEGSIADPFAESTNGGLLASIEGLLFRVNEFHTSPTLSTVESVWWILQQEWRQPNRKLSKNHPPEPRRTIILLGNWTAWSQQVGTPLFGRPPPIKLVMQLFHDTTTMSTDLWKFYRFLIHSSAPTSRSDEASRYDQKNTLPDFTFIELGRIVLQILSNSGSEWESYQCQVIQSIVRSSYKTDCNATYVMSLLSNEIWRAFYESAKAGCVADTAWLGRFIESATPEISESTSSEIHLVLLESLFHSRDAGSLLYMERFLMQRENGNEWGVPPFNGTTCQMLLAKYAKTAAIRPYYSTASLGRRAERFLHWASKKLYSTQWYPHADCADYVLEAYLPKTVGIRSNSSFYLSRIRKADYFVRNFVRQFQLQPRVDYGEDRMNTSYRIFERLFDAYNDAVLISLQSDDEQFRVNATWIALQGDELFRFFLIHHRDGRIHTEAPSMLHLQQLIRLWNSCQSVNATAMIDIPQKEHEYRRILQLSEMQVGTNL